jgi:pimeloyl-ACP methyl ester carboxylesterase
MMSTSNEAIGSYAEINGLRLYYEIHGTGQPMVLLHGSFMTINAMQPLVSELAKTRQVVALELQGHGHTADIDRPLRYEGLADDVFALLQHLNIKSADVFGYSLGGGVALQFAIRHPEVLRKLIVASASYNSAGLYPEVLPGIAQITPELFAGTPWRIEYNQIAPRPQDFANLVAKIKELNTVPQDWSPDLIQAIQSPTLVIIGDADGTRPEHAVEMFRLLGGGVFGDLAGLPKARLAILPGTTHVGVLQRSSWLVPLLIEFLDANMP